MAVYSDVALSQQITLMRDLQNTSSNVANLKTPGFQAKQLIMGEQQVKPTMTDSYSFVDDILSVRDVSQGRFTNTGNPLHAYINGHAYFAVQTPQGVQYTKNGAFTLNEQNELVTADGYLVLDEGNSPITLPEGITDITFATDGTLSSPNGQIGKFGLFSFQNENLLKDVGNNLLTSNEQPNLAEYATVTQFGFEGSNVNEIFETTHMMDILRRFQQIQKFIEQDNQRQTQAIQSLLKISSSTI